jgi:hypothetical protein
MDIQNKRLNESKTHRSYTTIQMSGNQDTNRGGNGMIEAKSVLSEEELLKGVKLHLRYNAPFRRRSTVFIAIVVLGVAAFSTLFGDPDLGTAALGGAGIVMLLMPIWSKWFVLKSFRKNFRKLPTAGKEVLWSFDEEYLSGHGEGFEFRTAWSNMFEAIMTPQELMIYPQKGIFHWIPTTAFDNQDTFEKAKNLVRQNVKSIRDV